MIKSLLKKFSYTCSGIRETWRSEPSFRQWFVLVLISDLSALYFLTTKIEIILILVLGWLLLASELINTAVEAVVNLVSPNYHILAKKSKDAASAMTFLTFLTILTSWLAFL